jgi:hypothetical protein
MPRESAQVHENRELGWARWVRRAAADIFSLRRSAPTWAPAPSLFSEQQQESASDEACRGPRHWAPCAGMLGTLVTVPLTDGCLMVARGAL